MQMHPQMGGFPGMHPMQPMQPMQPNMQPMQPNMMQPWGGQQIVAPTGQQRASQVATAKGSGFWQSLAGGPTTSYLQCGGAEGCFGPPIFKGARFALILFAISCLLQLVVYFILASLASYMAQALDIVSFATAFLPESAGVTDWSALLKVSSALFVVAGVLFTIGLIASLYYICTMENNINKTRARQMWLMHSFVFVVGTLLALVATIVWTVQTPTAPAIVCPIVWLFIDLYNNYVLWSNFVLTP